MNPEQTSESKLPCDLGATLGVLLLRIWLALRAIGSGIEKYAGTTVSDKAVMIDGAVNSYGLTDATATKVYGFAYYHGVPAALMDKFASEPLLPDEQTGWSDWSDWTYTIYPDGVATKRMRLWSTGPYNHEWQEGMVIFGPDQHPEQVIQTNPALSLATLSGETRDYSWESGPPKGVNYRDTKIHVVHFKGDYSPFTIGEFTNGNVYSGEVTETSVFPWWNHWPIGQLPSDGRNAKHPDRTSHCSLTHVFLPNHKQQDGDRPYQERLLMEGMTKLKPAELVPLAKSWLQAPPITARSGCQALPYEPASREYPLIAEKDTMAVSIDASPEHPVTNLCLTVKNWGHSGDAKFSVKGAEVRDLRQGTVLDTDGRRKLVLWLEMEATTPVDISIEGAKPINP